MSVLRLKYSQKKMAGKDPTNPLPHLSLTEFLLSCFSALCSLFVIVILQDLTEENKILDRLVKRQSVTLNRLTSSHGELPNLIFAHSEELRVARHKMKQVQ